IATLQSRAETNPDGNSARMKAGPHDSTFVEIIAVRSTGSLVDGSDARVCGVLTGVTVPPSGGSSSAVIDFSPVHRIVGMFDLPQNHFAPTGAVAAQHG
ncbi:MAG TPA: hypothetical protein VHU80_13665, partial [Polyangiaceae bacterium]|nr:hypothetical protein [Polyangiaceae bacterium]